MLCSSATRRVRQADAIDGQDHGPSQVRYRLVHCQLYVCHVFSDFQTVNHGKMFCPVSPHRTRKHFKLLSDICTVSECLGGRNGPVKRQSQFRGDACHLIRRRFSGARRRQKKRSVQRPLLRRNLKFNSPTARLTLRPSGNRSKRRSLSRWKRQTHWWPPSMPC